MRKLTALILALMMLMTSPLAALADRFDRSAFEGRYFDSVATLDLNDSGDAAFIESHMNAASRSFTTPYEHDRYYNTTQWDILVLDYDSFSPSPRFRVWVSYFGTQYANIEGVSFRMGGKTYSFIDVAVPDEKRYIEEYDAYYEGLVIIFDEDNKPFLAALETYCASFSTEEEMDANPIIMTLHGDEDITVTLGAGFMADFIIVKKLFIECGGMDYLQYAGGNTMIVSNTR